MLLYTVLCVIQVAIGVLMFCFGIVHRTAIQVQYSFMMLPIWIGILAVLTGLLGIIMGSRNRQGFPSTNMVSGIQAFNAISVGLSFMAFYVYGTDISFLALRNAYNAAIAKHPNKDPNSRYVPLPYLLRPIDAMKNDATIQGIWAVIMVLCLAEILVGCFMAILVKNQMMTGSQNRQQNTYSMPSHVTAPQQAPPQQVPYSGPEPKGM